MNTIATLLIVRTAALLPMAAKAGIAPAFIASVGAVIVPGTTLVFTDKPVSTETQSGPNFKILGLGEVATR